MSAREIIAQIEALPETEKAVVFEFVTSLTAAKSDHPESKQIRYASDVDFERVKKEVFSKHAPLLQKLAK